VQNFLHFTGSFLDFNDDVYEFNKIVIYSLFHTKISNVVLKMEVEALEYTLNFLENCDLHIMYSFMDW
jgi:hypothetical protein